MEERMFPINSMRSMEVIDINTGTRLGFIKDMRIDCDQFKVLSLIIPKSKASFFSKNNIIEIPWENVKKVGIDVILVDTFNLDVFDKK